MFKGFFVSLLFVNVFSAHLGAKEDSALLSLCAEGRVEKLHAADVIELENGVMIRLMMVQVPHIPSGSETVRPWPMSEAIFTAMANEITGKNLSFHCLKKAHNRHGELVAMVKMPDGTWLQSLMITRGWARVYSTSDYAYAVDDLYTLEDKTRDIKSGLWSYDSYAVREISEIDDRIGRFEIVEGRVFEVAETKKATYMNFGEDWRKDFTLKMDWRARRLFKKLGIDPSIYEGKNIQVRGWVSWNGGPMMDLTHPEQIRLLDDGGE